MQVNLILYCEEELLYFYGKCGPAKFGKRQKGYNIYQKQNDRFLTTNVNTVIVGLGSAMVFGSNVKKFWSYM